MIILYQAYSIFANNTWKARWPKHSPCWPGIVNLSEFNLFIPQTLIDHYTNNIVLITDYRVSLQIIDYI